MADQETTVPMDDQGLLSSIMADEAKEPAVETPIEQPRDDQGRFAPKEEAEAKPAEVKPAEAKPAEPQPEAKQAVPEDDKTGNVPSWRLREEREAREAALRRVDEESRARYALQSQLQDMQRQMERLQAPKQEPVDFFTDPNAAFKQQLSPFEQRFESLASEVRLNTSKAMAVSLHGAQPVMEMEQAIEKAMAANDPDMMPLAAQMRASNDPVSVAMKWHQSRKLWETTGGDPDAYRQRVLDEAMKNPEFQAKVIELARGQAPAQSSSRPNIQLPPSLNKASGSGSSTVSGEDADMSDRALFAHAMRG